MRKFRFGAVGCLPASLIALIVFVAALVPRLHALATFLTIDELKWAEGSAQFLLALQSGDLFQTYWHFHPGITVTWGSALIIGGLCLPAPEFEVCVNSHVENLANSIGWLRLSPVLLTSLGVAGVYALGRLLLNDRLALLAALLLAFDPFFIAHSRILNGDAGAAILMFLSLIAFLIYWLGETNEDQLFSGETKPLYPQHVTDYPKPEVRNPKLELNSVSDIKVPILFLLLSGIFAGLAFLTKLPAPLLGLFVAGLGLLAMIVDWRRAGCSAVPRWIMRLLLWGGVALLTFVLVWPAMWTAPFATLRLIYHDTFAVGGAGQGHDTFFLGQTSSDPGPWFYPYVIAFRLTPVVVVGLLLVAAWLVISAVRSQVPSVRRIFDDQYQSSHIITALVMLGYICVIILFSNLSPKKLDRYVMSVVPALALLAAMGLEFGISLLVPLIKRPKTSSTAQPSIQTTLHLSALAVLIVLQLFSAIFARPYYLTYYNPLLGGVRQIAIQAPVGWGEGLEQAAYYLNSLPQAESLKVSSWYSDIFQSYFVGQRASFSDDGRAQLGADYVVFYVNQMQRQKPYSGLVDYFRNQEPEFVVAVRPNGQVVNLSGGVHEASTVSWVEVYRAPAAQSAIGAPKIEGVAQLLAYKVNADRTAAEVAVTLYMRVLGPLPENTTFNIALIRDTKWGQWKAVRLIGEWRVDQIVEWQGLLTLPSAFPPGDYRLWAGLEFEDGSVIAEFPISEKDPPFILQ